MFTCRHAADLLLDFLEGALPPETRTHFARHLADCPPCLRFVDTYRRTTVICRDALRRDMPGEVSDRLLQFLRQNRVAAKKDDSGT